MTTIFSTNEYSKTSNASTTDNNHLCRITRFDYWKLLLIGLWLYAPILRAQTPEDSAALSRTTWQREMEGDGITVERTGLRLFNSDQQISKLSFDPKRYRLSVGQQTNRTTVKRLGKQSGAEAAINGGFFVTKTRRAEAVGLTKSDGRMLSQRSGWGNAAVAIDSAGGLYLFSDLRQRSSEDSLWHHPYPEVMEAGPMLCAQGRVLFPADYSDTVRHPRSAIGIRSDSTVVLLVVDGRQEGAEGVSFPELAFICHMLGCRDALNLDGGGSSTLWSEKTGIVNRPSDRIGFIRIPRKVGNGLLLHKR